MKSIVVYLFYMFLLSCGGDEEMNQKPSTPPPSELSERWRIVNAAQDSILEGDLVTRFGNDFTSVTLRDFSQLDRMYSHSGIALKIDSALYIYHNMAGELNPNEIMRRDPIDSFLTPVNNIAFGIYRYDMNDDEISRLREIVMTHYLNKLQFDMNFDMANDDKMYCSEMIAKSVNKATGGRIIFNTSLMNDELKMKYLKMALQRRVIPSAKTADVRRYLGIDNLYLNPHCRVVYKHVFQQNSGLISIPPPETDSTKK